MTLRILVPFYNAAETLPRLIESLGTQTDKDFEVLFLDDASKDDSRKVFDEAVIDFPNVCENSQYSANEENIGIMRNVLKGVEMTDDDTICCICDGDDFLFPEAVETVKKYYKEHDLDFAWSNFMFYPTLKPGFSREINHNISARVFYPFWWMSHMRTWKAGTFKKIDYEKKFKWQGEWFDYANDLAIMFALQEVTDKYMHIPEILYYHDVSEGENTTRAPEKRKKQLIEETRIRSLFEDEDALQFNQYMRHIMTFYEGIMAGCDQDPEFKALLKSKGFPVG